MHFTKMQAYGNDYVYIQLFTQKMDNCSKWARLVSKRHYGIGSDGMILLCPSDIADFKMRVFNPDGSEAEMCGNALRSSAMLFYESGFSKKEVLTVETLSGIKTVYLETVDGHVSQITACIGAPEIISSGHLTAENTVFEYSYINVGNPHCVIFCDDPEKIDIDLYGYAIEHHKLFPDKANVEFCSIVNDDNICIRTWERSCGETLCCATGSACSTVASAFIKGTHRSVNVHNRGGDIYVEWKNDEMLYITGKSNIIFTGEISEKLLEEI